MGKEVFVVRSKNGKLYGTEEVCRGLMGRIERDVDFPKRFIIVDECCTSEYDPEENLSSSSPFVADSFWISSDEHDSRLQESSLISDTALRGSLSICALTKSRDVDGYETRDRHSYRTGRHGTAAYEH
ncbi:hypothetical protein J6590_079346 [Homalodisca vitripennis]|nr:hypothetical protein J6590_079346 [Homalodisca vitripennis]